MEMKRTISGMIGKGSIAHNERKFIAENVDADRTIRNVVLQSENVKDVYHELFDKAIERYNAKQKRKDRKMKRKFFLKRFAVFFSHFLFPHFFFL